MKCSEFCKLEELDCARCEKSYAILDHLAAYEDTGLEPEEITAIKNALMGRETAKITEFEGIPIKRMIELVRAEKDGRLVVLPPEGEDSAALAAMIDGDDRLRVWCIGNSDLLIGLLSTLAGEVADGLGTKYSTLLMSMATKPPVKDLLDGKDAEHG